MSDYRHDIYGPKGLSQLSGLYTVKSHALESVNDDEIKADTLKGKNLLHNGKPYIDWDNTKESPTWDYSRGDSHVFIEHVADEYFHINWPSTINKTKNINGTLLKFGIYDDVYKESGEELLGLMGGVPITISYEYKGNGNIAIMCGITVISKTGERTAYARNDTALDGIVDEWTKVSFSFTLPYDWSDICSLKNTNQLGFRIQATYQKDTYPDSGEVDLYIRNIKLEYGTEATEYTMSDWDRDYLYEQTVIPEGTKSITANGTYDVTNYASASVNVYTGEEWEGASTAQLTVTANGVSSSFSLACPYIATRTYNNQTQTGVYNIIPIIGSSWSSKTDRYNVILNEDGQAILENVRGWTLPQNIVLSGSIAADGDNKWIITGPATITFAG